MTRRSRGSIVRSRHPLLRSGVRVVLIAGIVLVLAALIPWWCCVRMPGRNHRGPLPPLTPEQTSLADRLRRDVRVLAGDIGERNVTRHPDLIRAQYFLEGSLSDMGYRVDRQGYEVLGRACYNLSVEVPGAAKASEIVVVGAHYDTCVGTPGADDNASAVAVNLALARSFKGIKPARTLRFVFFVNEEPEYFQTVNMGSWVYATRSEARGEDIVGMLSLEMLGVYSDEPGSQRYPFPFKYYYPDQGNFVAFVGNLVSRSLVRQCVRSFREAAAFPAEGLAAPERLGVIAASDHWSFWRQRYQALMVTDTAWFRNRNYHEKTDTWDTLDYGRMARVTEGLVRVVANLAENIYPLPRGEGTP